MFRCKHCGEQATSQGCPHCNSTAIERLWSEAGDALGGIDVTALIDVTAVGDTEYRYFDPHSGKIVIGGPIQWTIGGETL